MTSIIVQEARQDFSNKMASKQDAIVTFAALMGRGDGTNPSVMGREGYVWVRVGHAQALQMAYNTRVMPRDDLAIYVGYQPEQPNLLQVISVRQESYVNTGQGVIPVVQDHHLTHEWGGGDDTWIAYRRIVDLHLGQPTGFVVTLNAGLVYRAGAYMWIPVQTLDLAGDQPHVGAQARYDLVYLDAAGVLSARPGNLRPNPTSLLVSDIPIPLAGEIAIAAVRLYASQTAIGDTPTDRDILELRDLQPYSSAGTHNVLSATHADSTAAACILGDIITGQAGPLWKRLAISVPGANVRNVLGVDNAETGPTWKAMLDAVNPTTIAPSDAAAPGTNLIASHRDHQHASPATWPATAHDLLSASHGDTLASAVSQGSLIYGNATPKWAELVLGGAAGSFLTRDANDVLWSGFYLTGTPGNTYDLDVAGGAHDILSATHTDSAAAAVVDGDIIIGNVTPAWSKLAISIPAANVRNVLGIDNAELRPSWKTALDVNNPTDVAAGGAADPGTSLVFSHRDHTHGAPATWAATAHALLSATHSDTVANGPTRGALIYGNSTPAWDKLGLGGAGGTINGYIVGSAVVRTALDVTWSAPAIGGTTNCGTYFNVTAGKCLVLTATDNYELTIPATGTAALLGTANVFTAGNTMSAILTVNANIQFPAVQVPNAGANVLDDYEEFTWTPVLKFGGASVDIAYGTQTGTYTKIGNLVHVECYIVLTSKGSSVGVATIAGLPFAAALYNAVAAWNANMSGITNVVNAFMTGSSVSLIDQAATGSIGLTNANFTNTSALAFGFAYRV